VEHSEMATTRSKEPFILHVQKRKEVTSISN